VSAQCIHVNWSSQKLPALLMKFFVVDPILLSSFEKLQVWATFDHIFFHSTIGEKSMEVFMNFGQVL